MYVDDCLFANSKYRNNKKALFTELETIKTDLGVISKALGSNEIQKVKLQVHQEMLEKFQAIALDTNVVELLENFGLYYSYRFEHKYPPGFMDSNKEYNSAGDLILWQEILQYCKSNVIKKVVLVTRDMKKDFVYAPKKIKENGKDRFNNGKIKIADERLVDEFRSKVGTESFFIINFQQLVGVLSKSVSSQYRNLAVSVQIDPYFVSQTVDEDNCESDSLEETLSEFVDSGEMPNEENIDETSLIPQKESGIVTTEKEKTAEREILNNYLQVALEDKKFPLDEGNKLHMIISDLRSHNWPIQNSAVEKLYSLSVRDFEATEVDVNSFFVLGRNVYQAACGNAFKAISLIENLSSFLSNIEQYILRKAFLDGTLYEVYFNHDNEYRKDGCRGDYLKSIKSCLKQEGYSASLEFINKRLEEIANAYICYPPLYEKQVIVSLSGKVEDAEFGSYFAVDKMEIDGKIADYEGFRVTFPCFVYIDNLKNNLSQLFAVDQELIKIEGLPNDIINEHRPICFVYPLLF